MKKLPARIITLVLSIVLFSSHTNKPGESEIIGFGVIKHESKEVSGVSVKVLQHGKLIESMVTGRNLGYGFTLQFNSEYDIEVAKVGFLKEVIHINTAVSRDVLSFGDRILWEPDIYIYKIMPGLEIDEFEKPVARYVFDVELWRFVRDENYNKEVESMISDVLNKISKLKEEAYSSEKNKADSLYSARNYEEAIIAYKTAQQYNSEEKHPSSQIKSAKKLLRKQYSVEKGYEQAIRQADEFLSKNDYEKANNYYQKALIYKPKERYPFERLYEIDSVKSYYWIELNKNFDKYVATADSLFSDEDYDSSKLNYSQALALFPNREYPQRMLNKIDSIEIVKSIKESEIVQESPEEVVDSSDQKYLALITGADEKFLAEEFEAADKLYQKALLEKPGDKYAERRLRRTGNRLDKETSSDQPVPVESLSDEEISNTKTKVDESSSAKVTEDEPTFAKATEGESALVETTKDEPSFAKASEDNAEKSLTQLKKALEANIETGDKNASSKILEEMGMFYQSEFDLNKALHSYNRSLELKRELGDKRGEAMALSNIASVMYDSGSYGSAIENFEQSLKLSEEINDKSKSSDILANIATVYENTYRYDEAIDNLKRSLEIKAELEDKEGTSETHKNIGNIYYEQNKFDLAIRELEKSLIIDEQLKNKDKMGATFNNLGAAYYSANQYDKAVDYYERSIEITEETNNQRDRSIALNNIGNISFDFSKFTKAIEYYEQSLEIKTDLSFNLGIATTLHNMGNAYFKLKKFDNAMEYYASSLQLAEDENFREVMWRNYEAFARTYAAMGNYKSAFEYFKKYTNSKFEIDVRTAQIVELREQYESSKIAVKTLKRELQKQNRLARYEAERNRKEMQIIELEMENKQQQVKKQRIAIVSFIIVSIIVLIFSVIITKQYRLKNKAFNIVADQKKHITDGISYAARIQNAVLPPEKYIQNIIPDRFIINKPRDVVGGDFYWAAKHFNKNVIAVADCTGHGVPGGFMSMLGIAILNEIISTEKPLEAHEILTQLRNRVVEALHQRHRLSETLDGMDITLVILDQEKKEIQFSAAYHSLYLIRNNHLEKIKGDRVPIGYHFMTKPFTSQTIQLQTGDMVYLATDGYTDQIGQKTHNRFMLSQFKDELIRIHDKPLEDQKGQLEKVLAEWQGSLEQTDDILVMGLRI